MPNRSHIPILALALTCVPVACACQGKGATAPPAAPESPEPPPSPPPRSPQAYGGPDRTLHMQVHFWAAIDARDALIGNDLLSARDSLTWLAEHQRPASVPASHGPWLQQMREAAKSGAEASDAAGVAWAVARLAQTCGACHSAVDATIAPGGDDEDQGLAPLGPEQVEDRMGRHAWSVEELWAGLVFPSDAAWARGVEVLREMPDEPPYTGREPVKPEIVHALQDVRALATAAEQAGAADVRAKVFADLLVSCQRCHAR